jgi:hypothetical protein
MKNNLATVWTSVLKFISTYNLEGLEARQVQLKDYLSHPLSFGCTDTNFNAEIRRVNSSVTFTVEFERDFESATYDEEGNRWYRFLPVVKMGWPGYGSATLDIIEERISLFEEVRHLCQAIEALIRKEGEIWSLSATKAELEAQEEKYRMHQTIQALTQAMESQTAGMKVGDQMLMDRLRFNVLHLTVGFERTLSVKRRGRTMTYTAKVVNTESFNVTRTA